MRRYLAIPMLEQPPLEIDTPAGPSPEAGSDAPWSGLSSSVPSATAPSSSAASSPASALAPQASRRHAMSPVLRSIVALAARLGRSPTRSSLAPHGPRASSQPSSARSTGPLCLRLSSTRPSAKPSRNKLKALW
ncbi:hypothetical protein ZWY2020_028434 [Hordeum vulgare]|nr:hypothetical protein ZWY2020_028434 [Hordeum vulgare]